MAQGLTRRNFLGNFFIIFMIIDFHTVAGNPPLLGNIKDLPQSITDLDLRFTKLEGGCGARTSPKETSWETSTSTSSLNTILKTFLSMLMFRAIIDALTNHTLSARHLQILHLHILRVAGKDKAEKMFPNAKVFV